MNSPPHQQTSVSKDEKSKKTKGLGKVLSKVRMAFRRGETSSASSLPQRTSATLVLPTVKPEAAITSKPVLVPKSIEARTRYEGLEGVTKIARSQLLEERAKKLAERYGLEINSSDWIRTTIDDTVLRMDKPIRIRIRRTCHKCFTALASAKECPNCQHLRCIKCPRYPPKRSEAEKFINRERRVSVVQARKENPPLVADYCFGERERTVLKKPAKINGQDLYHKKPRQRIRRTCHECQTLFIGANKKCQGCGHIRCTDCPRDPPKKDRYPLGYPGDAFGPNSVPHYECDRCETLFPVAAEYGTACRKCGTEKSVSSPRALPRKFEPELDIEIMKKIQAKIEKLKVV